MKTVYIAIGLGALVAVAFITRNKMASQAVGTSTTVSPKTTKLTGVDKSKHNISEHRAGTNERRILQLAAKVDPNRAVSPDGRIWAITKKRHRVTGKTVWEVGGNNFDSKAEAKQWVGARG